MNKSNSVQSSPLLTLKNAFHSRLLGDFTSLSRPHLSNCRWNQYFMRCQNSNDDAQCDVVTLHLPRLSVNGVEEWKYTFSPSLSLVVVFQITFIDIRDNRCPTECETLLLFVCLPISYITKCLLLLLSLPTHRKYEQDSNESETDDEVERSSRKKKLNFSFLFSLCGWCWYIVNWVVIRLQERQIDQERYGLFDWQFTWEQEAEKWQTTKARRWRFTLTRAVDEEATASKESRKFAGRQWWKVNYLTFNFVLPFHDSQLSFWYLESHCSRRSKRRSRKEKIAEESEGENREKLTTTKKKSKKKRSASSSSSSSQSSGE